MVQKLCHGPGADSANSRYRPVFFTFLPSHTGQRQGRISTLASSMVAPIRHGFVNRSAHARLSGPPGSAQGQGHSGNGCR
ncbi:hypothetical protein D3C85_1665940 [compost metagenome]